jgi:hypothetical protein
MKIYNVFLILLLLPSLSYSQELNCKVTVVPNNIQTVDKRVFQTLEKSLMDFMNSRRWTNDIFAANERIVCDIGLNITKEEGGVKFTGKLSVVSSRPVFNTSYKSPILNLVDDDIVFNYVEYQPIEFNENSSSNSNLASIFAFYAYIILGLDYDSFAPKGGAQWFSKAQGIVNVCQNKEEPGWKSSGKIKSRYWLMENLTNNKYDAFHTIFYNYHREGMDKMFDNPETARKTILNQLTTLSTLQQNNPNSMIIAQFFSAKSNELRDLFSNSPADEKAQAIQILTSLDPTNASNYQKINK